MCYEEEEEEEKEVSRNWRGKLAQWGGPEQEAWSETRDEEAPAQTFLSPQAHQQ